MVQSPDMLTAISWLLNSYFLGKNLSHFRLLNMMKLLGGPQVIEPPSVRVEMVDDFWKSMKEKGIVAVYGKGTLLMGGVCSLFRHCT